MFIDDRAWNKSSVFENFLPSDAMTILNILVRGCRGDDENLSVEGGVFRDGVGSPLDGNLYGKLYGNLRCP